MCPRRSNSQTRFHVSTSQLSLVLLGLCLTACVVDQGDMPTAQPGAPAQTQSAFGVGSAGVYANMRGAALRIDECFNGNCREVAAVNGDRDIQLFRQSLTEMKEHGFNTVYWLNWWVNYHKNITGNADEDYDLDRFELLRRRLAVAQELDFQVIFPMNLVLDQYPRGADLEHFIMDPVQQQYFRNYLNRFMAETRDYADRIHMMVFLENVLATRACVKVNGVTYVPSPATAGEPRVDCDPGTPGYLERVRAFRRTLGRLPLDLDRNLAGQFHWGFHDAEIVSYGWTGNEDPIDPTAFEFISVANYPEYGWRVDVNNEAPFAAEFRANPAGMLADLWNNITGKLAPLAVKYPGKPVIMAELGFARCTVGSAIQASIVSEVVRYARLHQMGFSVWDWLPPQNVPDACTLGAYGATALTQLNGGLTEEGVAVTAVVRAPDNAIPPSYIPDFSGSGGSSSSSTSSSGGGGHACSLTLHNVSRTASTPGGDGAVVEFLPGETERYTVSGSAGWTGTVVFRDPTNPSMQFNTGVGFPNPGVFQYTFPADASAADYVRTASILLQDGVTMVHCANTVTSRVVAVQPQTCALTLQNTSRGTAPSTGVVDFHPGETQRYAVTVGGGLTGTLAFFDPSAPESMWATGIPVPNPGAFEYTFTTDARVDYVRNAAVLRPDGTRVTCANTVTSRLREPPVVHTCTLQLRNLSRPELGTVGGGGVLDFHPGETEQYIVEASSALTGQLHFTDPQSGAVFNASTRVPSPGTFSHTFTTADAYQDYVRTAFVLLDDGVTRVACANAVTSRHLPAPIPTCALTLQNSSRNTWPAGDGAVVEFRDGETERYAVTVTGGITGSIVFYDPSTPWPSTWNSGIQVPTPGTFEYTFSSFDPYVDFVRAAYVLSWDGLTATVCSNTVTSRHLP